MVVFVLYFSNLFIQKNRGVVLSRKQISEKFTRKKKLDATSGMILCTTLGCKYYLLVALFHEFHYYVFANWDFHHIWRLKIITHVNTCVWFEETKWIGPTFSENIRKNSSEKLRIKQKNDIRIFVKSTSVHISLAGLSS